MITKHIHSFKNAFAGLIWAVKTESNYKIHLLLSVITILAGFILRISYIEFLIILTFIILGLTIEMINTALEETTDAIDKNERQDIRIAKDVSAGAMLIFSFGALSVACIIFVPKILKLLNF